MKLVFFAYFFMAALAQGAPVKASITRYFEIYRPQSEADVQAAKDMGFNQVALDRDGLAEKANQLGMRIMLGNWWSTSTPWTDIQPVLELAAKLQREGASVFVSMMDEPDTNDPAQHPVSLYQSLHDRIKKAYPGIPLTLSHWGPVRDWPNDWDVDSYVKSIGGLYQSVENMRIMPYPVLRGEPMNEVFLMMQRSRELMTRMGTSLPLTAILQTWTESNQDAIPLLPTLEQLRVMAYEAMLSGAETLSFYDYNPAVWNRVPGFTTGMRVLLTELNGLSNRFKDSQLSSDLDGNRAVLLSNVTASDGAVSCIRVNTTPYAMSGLRPYEIAENTGACP